MTIRRRIVVTRPLAGQSRTAVWIKALGHEALACPLTRIEPLDQHIEAAAGAVIATSANAFRHLPQTMAARLAHLPTFVVGEQTRRAAEAKGFRRIEAVAPDAAGLEQHLAGLDGETVSPVYLAGRVRTAGVEQAARRLGLHLSVVETYDTAVNEPGLAALAAAWRSAVPDAMIFHSARSVELAYGALDGLASHRAIANCCAVLISERLLETLPPFAHPACLVATTPDEDGLERAVSTVFSPLD